MFRLLSSRIVLCLLMTTCIFGQVTGKDCDFSLYASIHKADGEIVYLEYIMSDEAVYTLDLAEGDSIEVLGMGGWMFCPPDLAMTIRGAELPDTATAAHPIVRQEPFNWEGHYVSEVGSFRFQIENAMNCTALIFNISKARPILPTDLLFHIMAGEEVEEVTQVPSGTDCPHPCLMSTWFEERSVQVLATVSDVAQDSAYLIVRYGPEGIVPTMDSPILTELFLDTTGYMFDGPGTYLFELSGPYVTSTVTAYFDLLMATGTNDMTGLGPMPFHYYEGILYVAPDNGGTLTVHNGSGQMVHERTMTGAIQGQRIDLRDLPDGVYVVTLTNGDSRSVRRFVVAGVR